MSDYKKIGEWYFPDNDKHFSEHFTKTGQKPETYQKKQREESLKYVKNFGVALDVGAHIGMWSYDLCSRFEEVIAFEPHPLHFELLNKNIKFINFTSYNYALGEKDDDFVFVGTDNPGNTGSVGIQKTGIKVPIKTLDSLNLEQVDYIKIDIEGYEQLFLLGALKTIKRCKPVIVLENKTSSSKYYKMPCRKMLESYGMKFKKRVIAEEIYTW